MGSKEAPYHYGGQAVLEGVMMRGRDTWAVACRRPTDEIYVETHAVSAWGRRRPIWTKLVFRGVAALAESLSIGMRAMMIAANQSLEEDQKLTRKQMGFTIAFAIVAFIGIFIILPNLIANAGEQAGRSTVWSHLKEGFIRLGIFLGYLVAISFMKEIRRVFAYHGAEHKTIAAYEADEEILGPESVDRYSTIHVRCGTNFLIIVMLLTIVLYSFLGRPAIWLQILERVALVFVIAGISYEGLRLGAAHLGNPVVRLMMAPGLWLQKITTRQPDRHMIEVAIRSFEAVLPDDQRKRVASLPSPVIRGARDDVEGEPGVTPS